MERLGTRVRPLSSCSSSLARSLAYTQLNGTPDGIKEKKQNSYDDMIFAAEHLISKGYTSAGKIILCVDNGNRSLLFRTLS